MTTLPPSLPPAAPVPPQPYYPPAPPPQRPSGGRRILTYILAIVLLSSLVFNFALLGLLAVGASQTGLQSETISEGRDNQVVAVYAVQGTIGEQMVAEFRRFHDLACQDDNIKAVVLRVDSPGGTVSASDQIHQMTREISERGKPVVVSMGGVAASGGYYVSAAAKSIVAEPTTITGSIGVISVWPVFKDFLANHGVDVVTIRSRQSEGFKAKENFWEEPDSRTRRDVQDMLTRMHQRFEQVVREGRPNLKTRAIAVTLPAAKEPVQEMEPLNGKVYLAQEAMDLGLVDKIGYLKDATAEAAQLAKLSKPKVVQYARAKGLRDLIGVSESTPLVDPKALDKLLSPQILMLWKVD